jgi:hypothetical protein
MCFEIVCRDDLKLSAMAPGVNACTASNVRIALLVGSAIAWNTSLRDFIMQLFDCKYMCSYLTAQIYFTIFQVTPQITSKFSPALS